MRSYYEYVRHDGEDFFTVVILPDESVHYPVVVMRNPYVGHLTEADENEIVRQYEDSLRQWTDSGYAVVYQHCRGQGKSTGAFVPYIQEREDSSALFDWIRKQDFYGGEMYLVGGSYTASLFYTAVPFASDIKGAVLEVQDCERYRLWYRNGQMRKGHANWHFSLYKAKCNLNKSFNIRSFSALPLTGLSEKVLGDRAEDFEQMLEAERPDHKFWSTRFGGGEAHNAVKSAGIPILFTSGYNDFYIGGMFAMWNELDDDTRKQCAFLVSPYDHGDNFTSENGLSFEKGRRSEQFGGYQIAWIENIRKKTSLPFEKGVITYYRTFENRWDSDFYATPTKDMRFIPGNDTLSLTYDPKDPPFFDGEGSLKNGSYDRGDVITLYTEPFEKDTFIKGKMKMQLAVSSDCADTSFYVRISIKTPDGDYCLRHDITSLCYQLGDYTENSQVLLNFTFDEYAFAVKKGGRLRVDIAPTDDNAYVCHTNTKGQYSRQTKAVTAVNTVYLHRSTLILPVENDDL